MTTMTKRDAVDAAMSVAEDVASGKLDPATLEQQAVAELRELVGTVVGEDDPLWDLQVQIASGVLASGGIPTDELSEWLAVARRRDGVETEPLSAPVPIPGSDTPSGAVSSVSGDHSSGNGAPDDLADVPRDVLREAESAAMAVITSWREGR
ncbi:hypothetical protein [Mycobacterium sp. D16R24]|uniref:hypothetical protein n=1 Tax=Mycobacterium sp. D16R24 TaxID=1855656 RepID=UPI00099214F9|nr:hypothetical protein [Mycobacterium sp. D16R24]